MAGNEVNGRKRSFQGFFVRLHVRISLGTILAVKYNDGVVLGAESCVSTCNTADNTKYADKADNTVVIDVDMDKIRRLAPKIYMALSGDAHGASCTLDCVKKLLGFKVEQGQPTTVKICSQFCRHENMQFISQACNKRDSCRL